MVRFTQRFTRWVRMSRQDKVEDLAVKIFISHISDGHLHSSDEMTYNKCLVLARVIIDKNNPED